MTKHTLQLPDDLYELLTTLASQAGKTPDQLIVAAIKEHLEDIEDIQAAERVLEARARRESTTYSINEVRRKLGLDD